MPLSDFLLGKDFPKMEPFVQALQQGMDNELVPLKKEITDLKQEIVQLKTLIGDATSAAAAASAAAQSAQTAASTAQNAATAASTAASNAQNTANDAQAAANNPPPPVTVTVTPPVTEGTTTSAGGTPTATTPTTTPTPETTSTTSRVADQLVLALADPFLIDQPVAVITGGGTYAIGDTVTLQTTNIRSGYSFNGWYNSTGQQVSADPTYTFTVASGGGSFTAKFVAVAQVQPTPQPPTVQVTTIPVSIQWSKAYVGGATGANLTISGNGQTVQNVVSPSTPVFTSLPVGTSVTVSINVAQMGARYAWIDLLNGGTVSNQRSFTFTLNEEIRYRCVVSA